MLKDVVQGVQNCGHLNFIILTSLHYPGKFLYKLSKAFELRYL